MPNLASRRTAIWNMARTAVAELPSDVDLYVSMTDLAHRGNGTVGIAIKCDRACPKCGEPVDTYTATAGGPWAEYGCDDCHWIQEDVDGDEDPLAMSLGSIVVKPSDNLDHIAMRLRGVIEA